MDRSFADSVLSDWDDAMDRFFSKVETLMLVRGLTPEQVRKELDRGYGYEVGDNWVDWIGDEEDV